MKLLNQNIVVIIGLLFIVACGSEPNQKTDENVVESSKEIVWQEFNISAVGNTMQDMKYDIENITVKENSWVRITLKNEGVDAAMLHNILFVNFGKRKDLAIKATEAGSAKEFIPEDENLIAASTLAKPGETVVLEFQAPRKGNYEFFCSYPGHAMMMRGYFFVK
jgi:azurin